MGRNQVIAVVVAFLGVSTASSFGADGSAGPTPAGEIFQSVEVTVVDVDVAATDRAGLCVWDLAATDFEIEVNGAPVAITHFSPPAAREQAPGSDGVNNGSVNPGGGRARSLAVLIDTSSGRSLQRNEAFRALAGVLPRIAARGRAVMIAVQDTHLRIVHAFTDDLALLPQRLREVGDAPVIASALGAEKQVMAAAMQNAFVMPGGLSEDGGQADWAFAVSEASGLLPRIRSYASALREEQQARIQSAGRLVASLAGLPGQKALLFLGGGFETEPGLDLFQLWAQRYPQLAAAERLIPDLEAQHYQIGEDLATLVSGANAASVTVYTLLTEQPAGLASMGVDRALPSGGSSILSRADRFVEGSLAFLADATGGFPVGTGTASARDVERLAETLDRVYSLGFAPPPGAGAGPHRITVRTRRDGIRLRHRESFQLRSLGETTAERTYAALLFGQQTKTLGGEVVVDAIVPQPDGTFHATFAASVPLANLALSSRQGASRR